MRCGRQNLSRARFCADCGLNLTSAGVDDGGALSERRGRRSGAGVVLFLVLLGLLLATVGSIYRVPRSHRQPARVLRDGEFRQAWPDQQIAEPEARWHLHTYDNEDVR